MKYKKGNYMQEFVIEVVQGSDPVKIPTKFFEHDKNAGTWSENTAMILRSFERSEYCAPIEDYYLQMQQFDQTIKLESVDCASFFFKVIKVVMDQAVARRYDGPLPQAMTCKNKQMVTSAMVVMRRIQNARLRILRKNGEKLLETGIFEKIGLTYGFQSKLLAPNVISFQLSKEFFCWAWLCSQAKRAKQKREKQIIREEDEQGFKQYCQEHGTPQIDKNIIDLMRGTRDQPSIGKIVANQHDYFSIDFKLNPEDPFGPSFPVLVTDNDEIPLEDGDRLAMLDDNYREHRCILQKSTYGALFLRLDVPEENGVDWASHYRLMPDDSVPFRLIE